MPTKDDADLILKLYDLRRDPVMREARLFVTTWEPQSIDEIVALQRDMGSQKNQYWRQVLGYWDMCAAFINNGLLDADLFLDIHGEHLFTYARFQPFFADYERLVGVPFMRQMAKLVQTHQPTRERYESMLKMLEARRQRGT